jgi:hypothetical protein
MKRNTSQLRVAPLSVWYTEIPDVKEVDDATVFTGGNPVALPYKTPGDLSRMSHVTLDVRHCSLLKCFNKDNSEAKAEGHGGEITDYQLANWLRDFAT